MFYLGMILSIFFLILSIILYVQNDVGKLIGDLTGWNAKISIKKMQKVNKKGSAKINVVKANIPLDGELLTEKKEEKWTTGEEATELLDNSKEIAKTEELKEELSEEEPETEVLPETMEEQLSEENETMLLSKKQPTKRLEKDWQETRVLNMENAMYGEELPLPDLFMVQMAETVIHTDEVIER